jgi:hypothetical protein
MSKKQVAATAREFLEGRCRTLADQARHGAGPDGDGLGNVGDQPRGNYPAPVPERPRPLATLQPGTTTGDTGLRLRNCHGWVFHYVADDGGRGDRVTVTRTYRGEPVGEYVMPRCEARTHYRSLREGGFETFGGDL